MDTYRKNEWVWWRIPPDFKRPDYIPKGRNEQAATVKSVNNDRETALIEWLDERRHETVKVVSINELRRRKLPD